MLISDYGKNCISYQAINPAISICNHIHSYSLYVFAYVFAYVSKFGKWQENPDTFVRDTKSQIVAKKDLAFMEDHPKFFEVQFGADFGDAVKAPNGVSAMLEDMFHLNRVLWNFSYADLNFTKSRVPVQVWWGSADDTAPHGKWICDQLRIEGRCIDGAGHGLIHSEFGPIVDDVLQMGS